MQVLVQFFQIPYYNMYSCTLCSKEYPKLQSLTMHVNSEHKQEKYTCDICNVQLSQMSSLLKHQRDLHKGEKIEFKCKKCSFSSKTYYTLNQHDQEEHTGKIIYSCGLCMSTFNYKYNLESHNEKVHKNQKIEECRICGIETSNVASHVKRVHQVSTEKCQYCDKFLKKGSSLKYHIKSKHELEKHPCNICDKVFTYRSGLTTHIREIHSGEKNFSCDQCEYRAIKASRLSNHKLDSHMTYERY